MKFEIDIEEGDMLILNSKRWRVKEISHNEAVLDPVVGEYRIFHKKKVEELMKYSGEVKLIREEYLQ